MFKESFSKVYKNGWKPLDETVESEMSLACTINDFTNINPDFSELYSNWTEVFAYEKEHYDEVLFSMLTRVVGEIKNNPQSRKLYFNFWSEKDNEMEVKSPCLSAIYFRLLESGKLNMSVVMRANNAFRIFPINLILFIDFFKKVAQLTGLKMNEYHHHALSLHIYKKDSKDIENSVYLKNNSLI